MTLELPVIGETAMETTYLICAVVGGTLIACQFLMTLFGLDGGDHDAAGGGHDVAGHGADAAGHHDAGHGNESSWFFGLLTFRTLSAALAFFGLTGLAATRGGMEPAPILLLSVGAAAIALFLVGWLMQAMSRLNVDGTMRVERAVGSRGTVYLPIPGERGGVGKVHISLLNRTAEVKAITSKSSLPTGTKIVVVGIVSSDTVEVASVTETEASSHV